MVTPGPGRRLSTASTARARCWSSPPPTSRTSSSRGPTCRPRWKASSRPSSALLAENRWPFRLHATYDETIRRVLDVFERGEPRHPARRAALVLRPCRDDLAAQHRPDRRPGRRHRRPAPHGLPGRVLRRALRRRRGRGDAAGRPHAGAGHAGRRRHRRDARRLLQPLGHRSPGWSPGETVGGLRLYPPRNRARPRDRRCGSGPRRTPGSPARTAGKGASRPASSPTSRCCPRTTSLCPEDAHRRTSKAC